MKWQFIAAVFAPCAPINRRLDESGLAASAAEFEDAVPPTCLPLSGLAAIPAPNPFVECWVSGDPSEDTSLAVVCALFRAAICIFSSVICVHIDCCWALVPDFSCAAACFSEVPNFVFRVNRSLICHAISRDFDAFTYRTCMVSRRVSRSPCINRTRFQYLDHLPAGK